MRWGEDEETRLRSSGPSKAELQRQLQDAVRNTGLPKELQQAPVEKIAPTPVERKTFAQSPTHYPKRAEPLVCEKCGGPRSQYSSARCRACYRGMRPDATTKVTERLRARRKEVLARAQAEIEHIDQQLALIDTPEK